eukprot:jgi/Tetstr1/463410/TSEL_000716.t1
MARWMLVLVVLGTLLTPPSGTHAATEADALWTFRNTIHDFRNGGKMDSWDNTTDHCTTWTGVSCSGGFVDSLDVSSDSLNGTADWLPNSLPLDLSVLTKMTSIDISGNDIIGSLPAAYSTWTALTSLSYGNNGQLTGTLPPQWSTLTSLTTIAGASMGGLATTLPPQWSTLTGLTSITMTQGGLTGTLPPEWSTLTGLTALGLNNNGITGTLPGTWTALTNIGTAWVFTNNAITKLHDETSGFTHLTSMDLSNNAIDALPATWSRLTGLQTLDLSNNAIPNLPAQWSTMTSATTMTLSSNALTSLPVSWSALTGLQT